MTAITLTHPVVTIDNKTLLPADTEITKAVLEKLIKETKLASYPIAGVLDYGSVKDDLLSFIKLPPYCDIFSDPQHTANLIQIMSNVEHELPILQSLDYFKKRDFFTYRHILMVFAISTLLSLDLIEDYQDLVNEASACPTHDLGKICVPLNILKKSGPLSHSELNIVKNHSIAGYILICYYRRDPDVLSARIARDHHEKKDGTGYPQGIEIQDLLTEIVTVSDIYDALISPRPYRQTSYDNRTALEEITVLAEKNEISMDIVRALVSHNRRNKPHYTACDVSTDKRGSPPPNNSYGIIVDD